MNLTLHIGETKGDQSGSESNEEMQPENNKGCCSEDAKHDVIVDDAVRRVLQILKEQQER